MVGALTSGVGLLAGMMLVGMGAAGGGAASAMNNNSSDSKEHSLILASESYVEAENWVNAIEGQIHEMGDQSGNARSLGGQAHRRGTRMHVAVRPEVRLQDVQDWITLSKWKIFDVYEGVRLLQIVKPPSASEAAAGGGAAGGGGGGGGATVKSSVNAFSPLGTSRPGAVDAPCMRVNIAVNASPADTFSNIINFSNSLQTGIIRSVRMVENIDNFTDIIHLKLEAMFLYPSWTGKNCFLDIVRVVF
jgi:hypothetical protein